MYAANRVDAVDRLLIYDIFFLLFSGGGCMVKRPETDNIFYFGTKEMTCLHQAHLHKMPVLHIIMWGEEGRVLLCIYYTLCRMSWIFTWQVGQRMTF